MHGDHNATASTEEYLEWIYRLSEEKERVGPSELAKSLDVSPASVSVMLKRLVDRGLVHHQPYGGITLTDAGREIAARVIRRHGLLERLLYDIVGIPWHRVDEVACNIEHYLTDEVEDRLAKFLDYPTTCPHGQPIDLEHAEPAVRLSELKNGESGVISRISNESVAFLQFVESHGLLPGVRLSLQERLPFGGPAIVTAGGVEHALGETAVRDIWVGRASIEPLSARGERVAAAE